MDGKLKQKGRKSSEVIMEMVIEVNSKCTFIEPFPTNNDLPFHLISALLKVDYFHIQLNKQYNNPKNDYVNKINTIKH